MIEFRTVTGNTGVTEGKLTGLVTPFNSQTVIGDLRADGFREQIAPGAFNKTLQERDIVLLWNHNADMPLARTSAGNLSLQESGDGLRMDSTPVGTSYGKDLMLLAQSGVVKGMSFGFEVIKDDWTDDSGNPADSRSGTNRVVREVRLHEVSAVTFPAYKDTTLSARDAINAAREGRGAAAEIPDGWDWRDKYNAKDRKAMAQSGQAMSDGSYPIKDAEDLQNAIHAVGRGNADHDAIRRHIMARAKALGLSADIPDNWNADGSLKQVNSEAPAAEQRDDPDGKEYAAMRKAIDLIKADKYQAAINALQACLPEGYDDNSDDDDEQDDSDDDQSERDEFVPEIEYADLYEAFYRATKFNVMS